MEALVVYKKYELCCFCMEEHQIEVVEIVEKNTYREVLVESIMHYEYCDRTDEYWEDEFLMRANNSSMYKAYVEKIEKEKENGNE